MLQDKNRYCDVLPFDYNRVILHRKDEDVDHGYINASLLKSKEDEPGPAWHYIVTQVGQQASCEAKRP